MSRPCFSSTLLHIITKAVVLVGRAFSFIFVRFES